VHAWFSIVMVSIISGLGWHDGRVTQQDGLIARVVCSLTPGVEELGSVGSFRLGSCRV